MRILAAVLLVAVAFAGCSDEAAPKEVVEPTSQKGCIQGVVVDSAIRPLEGATVSLPRMNASVVTAADGVFSFCELDPGLYVLQASRVDFLPVETNAVVRAGETATPQVLLPADPTPKPFHRVLKFTGFVNASAGMANSIADPVLEQFGVSACHCKFSFQAEAQVNTFIIEADWEDSIPPGPAGPTQFYAQLAAAESGLMHEEYLVDPGYWYLQGSDFDDADRTYEVRLYSDDVWPAVQQDYELYVTVFYYGEPPEGWSFLEGST